MPFVVQDMSMTYTTSNRDVPALDRVSLKMADNEFVSLIGPSGCGKSTMLHAMGGLLPDYEGEISFDGVTINKPDPRRAAFIFQDYSLLPWRTVVENAAIGLRFAGVPRKQRLESALRLLKINGLEKFADSYPHELSGGMQQRVAVARAMAMDPEVLLMDEPFGALDEITRRDLGYEIAKSLSEQQRSVVMVTHSLDEAVFWADRIIVMSPRPGRIMLEINVPVPRPRELSFIASKEFGEIRARLFEHLSDAMSLSETALPNTQQVAG